MQKPVAGDGARLLVLDNGTQANAAQLTPHRLEANEPIQKGDRLRLTIESPATGYVYIIDQELHANGRTGPPYLVFPTTRTRNGSNAVTAGQLLEVPAQTDTPNVFHVQPIGTDESGEKLTVIVSPEPVSDFKITDREQELPAGLLETWLRRWGGETEQFELVGGRGLAWTETEKAAGNDEARLLTRDDPPPQTVLSYRGGRVKRSSRHSICK